MNERRFCKIFVEKGANRRSEAARVEGDSQAVPLQLAPACPPSGHVEPDPAPSRKVGVDQSNLMESNINEEMVTNAEIGHSVDTVVKKIYSDTCKQHSRLSQEQTTSVLIEISDHNRDECLVKEQVLKPERTRHQQ